MTHDSEFIEALADEFVAENVDITDSSSKKKGKRQEFTFSSLWRKPKKGKKHSKNDSEKDEGSFSLGAMKLMSWSDKDNQDCFDPSQLENSNMTPRTKDCWKYTPKTEWGSSLQQQASMKVITENPEPKSLTTISQNMSLNKRERNPKVFLARPKQNEKTVKDLTFGGRKSNHLSLLIQNDGQVKPSKMLNVDVSTGEKQATTGASQQVHTCTPFLLSTKEQEISRTMDPVNTPTSPEHGKSRGAEKHSTHLSATDDASASKRVELPGNVETKQSIFVHTSRPFLLSTKEQEVSRTIDPVHTLTSPEHAKTRGAEKHSTQNNATDDAPASKRVDLTGNIKTKPSIRQLESSTKQGSNPSESCGGRTDNSDSLPEDTPKDDPTTPSFHDRLRLFQSGVAATTSTSRMDTMKFPRKSNKIVTEDSHHKKCAVNVDVECTSTQANPSDDNGEKRTLSSNILPKTSSHAPFLPPDASFEQTDDFQFRGSELNPGKNRERVPEILDTQDTANIDEATKNEVARLQVEERVLSLSERKNALRASYCRQESTTHNPTLLDSHSTKESGDLKITGIEPHSTAMENEDNLLTESALKRPFHTHSNGKQQKNQASLQYLPKQEDTSEETQVTDKETTPSSIEYRMVSMSDARKPKGPSMHSWHGRDAKFFTLALEDQGVRNEESSSAAEPNKSNEATEDHMAQLSIKNKIRRFSQQKDSVLSSVGGSETQDQHFQQDSTTSTSGCLREEACASVCEDERTLKLPARDMDHAWPQRKISQRSSLSVRQGYKESTQGEAPQGSHTGCLREEACASVCEDERTRKLPARDMDHAWPQRKISQRSSWSVRQGYKETTQGEAPQGSHTGQMVGNSSDVTSPASKWGKVTTISQQKSFVKNQLHGLHAKTESCYREAAIKQPEAASEVSSITSRNNSITQPPSELGFVPLSERKKSLRSRFVGNNPKDSLPVGSPQLECLDVQSAEYNSMARNAPTDNTSIKRRVVQSSLGQSNSVTSKVTSRIDRINAEEIGESRDDVNSSEDANSDELPQTARNDPLHGLSKLRTLSWYSLGQRQASPATVDRQAPTECQDNMTNIADSSCEKKSLEPPISECFISLSERKSSLQSRFGTTFQKERTGIEAVQPPENLPEKEMNDNPSGGNCTTLAPTLGYTTHPLEATITQFRSIADGGRAKKKRDEVLEIAKREAELTNNTEYKAIRSRHTKLHNKVKKGIDKVENAQKNGSSRATIAVLKDELNDLAASRDEYARESGFTTMTARIKGGKETVTLLKGASKTKILSLSGRKNSLRSSFGRSSQHRKIGKESLLPTDDKVLSLSERKNSLRSSFSRSSLNGKTKEAEALQQPGISLEGTNLKTLSGNHASYLTEGEAKAPSLSERKNCLKSSLGIRYQKEIVLGEAQPQPEGVGLQEETFSTSGGNRSPMLQMEGRTLSLSGRKKPLGSNFFIINQNESIKKGAVRPGASPEEQTKLDTSRHSCSALSPTEETILSLSERKNSLRSTFSRSSQNGVVEAEALLQSEALTTEEIIVSAPQDRNRSTLLPSEERVLSLSERKNCLRSSFSRSKQNEPDREEALPQTKDLSGEERSTGGPCSNRSIQFPAEVPLSERKNIFKPRFGLNNRQVNHHVSRDETHVATSSISDVVTPVPTKRPSVPGTIVGAWSGQNETKCHSALADSNETTGILHLATREPTGNELEQAQEIGYTKSLRGHSILERRKMFEPHDALAPTKMTAKTISSKTMSQAEKSTEVCAEPIVDQENLHGRSNRETTTKVDRRLKTKPFQLSDCETKHVIEGYQKPPLPSFSERQWTYETRRGEPDASQPGNSKGDLPEHIIISECNFFESQPMGTYFDESGLTALESLSFAESEERTEPPNGSTVVASAYLKSTEQLNETYDSGLKTEPQLDLLALRRGFIRRSLSPRSNNQNYLRFF